MTARYLLAPDYAVPVMMIGVLAALALAWNSFVGLSWTPPLFVLLIFPALLIAATVYYRRYRPAETVLSEISLYAALWMLFPIFGTRLTYLAFALNYPQLDWLFNDADTAMGFDWHAWTTFVFSHPWIYWTQAIAYHSSMLQPLVVIPLLAYFGPRGRNWELLTAILIALFITIIIAGLMPASGPALALGIRSNLDPILAALKSGNPESLPYNGIIWFPSYHTVMGLLFTWSQRGIHWSFPIFAAVNSVMILATLAIGNHYLIDIPGGIAVAGFSVLAVHFITKRHQLSSV